MSLSATEARRIAEEAVDQAGGARQIYSNPRHPFAPNATRRYEIEGQKVTLRFGESSSPAIVEVGPYVYEIQEEGIVQLFGPKE